MSKVHVAPSATANGELKASPYTRGYGAPPLSVVPSEQLRLQLTSDGQAPAEQVITEETVGPAGGGIGGGIGGGDGDGGEGEGGGGEGVGGGGGGEGGGVEGGGGEGGGGAGYPPSMGRAILIGGGDNGGANQGHRVGHFALQSESSGSFSPCAIRHGLWQAHTSSTVPHKIEGGGGGDGSPGQVQPVQFHPELISWAQVNLWVSQTSSQSPRWSRGHSVCGGGGGRGGGEG